MGHPLHLDSLAQHAYDQDQANPGRICAWCLNPRNSAACDFGDRHHRREHFA